MQLDSDALDIVVQIANLRVTLQSPRAGLDGATFREVFAHRRKLEAHIETLKERLLNHCLLAVGMEHAIDRETLALPVSDRRHPRQFAAPERPEVKALEIPQIHK